LNALPPILNLVVIRSVDIHQSVRFYQALGFDFALERHGGGPEHYASVANGVDFEIYPLAAGGNPTTDVRIGFAVDSVEDATTKLRSIGAEVVSEPHDSEWGRRAVLRDFDGRAVELVEQARG
jgi:predicted enzyme related to lactoylglutathione lyase